MKKLLFLLLVAFATPVVAQEYTVEDGAVKFTRIYEDTGLDVQECHDRVFAYFASYFNNSNYTCRMDTPSLIIYKGVFGGVGTANMGYITLDAEYELQISIKDGRMRAVLTASTILCSSNPPTSYQLVEAAPIAEEHDAWETGVYKKAAVGAFDGLCSRVKGLFDDLGEGLIVKVDDEW